MWGVLKYRALAPMYYRGAAAAIITYDVTRDVSMNFVIRYWAKNFLLKIFPFKSNELGQKITKMFQKVTRYLVYLTPPAPSHIIPIP